MNSEEINELKEKITAQFSDLGNISDEEKEYKNNDIKGMIKYYNDLTSVIEDRRNKLQNFTLQFLVILVTALGVLTAFGDNYFKSQTLFIIEVVLWIQLGFSIWVVLLFVKQSGFRYPFLSFEEFGNKWKWFYYGNPKITEISTRELFPSKNPLKTKKPYLEGLSDFVNNYTNEDLGAEIRDNLQHLYLLQVHNYYKNKFYLRLVFFRELSIWTSIVVVVIYLLVNIFF